MMVRIIMIMIMIIKHLEHSPSARNRAVCFMYAISLNPHNNPLK